MPACFISYSHKDAQIAIAIQNILEQNGIKCWIDFRDAIPGADYASSIVHAIKESDVFILVLSQNSNNSTHVLNEINSAANAGITIIPFKVDDSELNESMEYYLGRTHWMDALTPPLENHINQLISRINCIKGVSSSVSDKSKPTPDKTECKMMKYQDLINLGYTSTSISLQLVENDYINCNGITTENEGTAQQWEEYLQDNSETFQYLINAENKIVGDWSIVALNDDAFRLAVNGELLESEINLDKTELICFPEFYKGYILTFSLLPQYRNMKNYNLIIDSFLSQLEEYAENGIYFKEWCINVFGKEVEAMVKQLGFKYLTDNKVLGKIYYCKFIPLPDIPVYKKHPKLVEAYSNVEF
ncbi:MAG: toll/interleukin-1 receptor domain-containing protein [Clostridia bacterium]|nr:toll/interleukin-1 receptor domain-containing protein [Clostridia bacterium]